METRLEFYRLVDCHSCFNRATLFRAWRPIIRLKAGLAKGASIEPRSFEHGDSMPSMPSGLLVLGFNRATLFRAWRLGLDWLCLPLALLASIEPRSFEHGDLMLALWPP